MPELRQISLSDVLADDAECLLRAREEANRIHASGDIRAAGNQVEVQARHVFRRRLPAKYRIAHGHAVDNRGFVSPQTDIIVADASNSAPLFQTEDGTEYVPYESVFALGEVKSTYYKHHQPLEKAIETIRAIRTGLFRPSTTCNPLFYFLLFVDSGDLDLEKVSNLYNASPIEDLPNITCWLDQGTLLYSRLSKNGLGELLPVNYLLSPSADRDPSDDHSWTLLPWSTDERRKGANLTALIGFLAQFMEHCVLEPPNLQRLMMLLTGRRYLLLR